MSQTASIWLVIIAAVIAANLPFINECLLGVVPLRRPKSLALRLAELVLLYFVVGVLAILLEQRAGQVAPQDWQFYAVTAAVFVTLSFPGFVWRYLVRHR